MSIVCFAFIVYYRIYCQTESHKIKVGQKPSLIEINGQLYDANSGRLFHHPRSPVIDGFVRKTQASQAIKIAATLSPLSPKLTSAKTRLHKPAQTVHKRTQRSKTLMRSAVNRPNSGNQDKTDHQPPKPRTGAPQKARLSRAMNMVKHSRVDRFGTPVSLSKSLSSHTAARPKPLLINNSGASPRAAKTAAVAVRPAPSMVTSVSHHRLERMLDEALISADAHKKAFNERIGKRRFSRKLNFLPRWLTITIATLVLASAGTYFAWRNIPYVSMKVASLRAQVKGSLPDYVPSGFRFAGPIEYEPGNISMTYRSGGERYFTLEQQASNWDSSSLEANALPEDTQVQTSQVKGTTVYVDSSNNEATWVNNGKHYKLRGQLNPDEIFKIAESIL
jgi:hypothetical protein